jgi:putative transposase
MSAAPDLHYRYRFLAEIISYTVWLYHVFSLRFRDVEPILAERDVVASIREYQAMVSEVRRELR